MTTFVDARAAALGITGPLTTDQRIALDLNAQIEKHQLALKALSDVVLQGINDKSIENAFLEGVKIMAPSPPPPPAPLPAP